MLLYIEQFTRVQGALLEKWGVKSSAYLGFCGNNGDKGNKFSTYYQGH